MVIGVTPARPAEPLSASSHARVAAALRGLPCTGENGAHLLRSVPARFAAASPWFHNRRSVKYYYRAQ